jgi:hypothetical protein
LAEAGNGRMATSVSLGTIVGLEEIRKYLNNVPAERLVSANSTKRWLELS